MLRAKLIDKPRQFLNPIYSKRPILEESISSFDNVLHHYKLKIEQQLNSGQSEPNIVSNALQPFFKDLGYDARSYSQSGQSGIDLALIKNDHPAVIIEAKVPGSTGMITDDNLNRRAFHETILYFMRERAKHPEIYHIIITDFYRWYIIDAKEYERLFWKNREFQKSFEYLNDRHLLSSTTKEFYEQIERYLDRMDESVSMFSFDLREYDQWEEKRRRALYKIFTPETLFKTFNPNDANTLNKEFYRELLYILGLEEIREKGKRLIVRSKKPQAGSLYENIARKLQQYGRPADFESVIQLMIVWINRLLFLKLLESQLIRWNHGDKSYAFLNRDKIRDFDRLETLFFEVLAKHPHERIHREFDYIPYLNSSLFEIQPAEREWLKISNLEDDCVIDYYSKTVLKEHNGRRRKGEANTLYYLFDFLDAYDFSSDGSEEKVKEYKTLINAAVLGLIFEKINGYKEGSFYTPGAVTMYMSKEAITRTVIDKFNTLKGWHCETLDEIYDRIDDKSEASRIIDSITICDPAVGSGHFLVSALNTLLEIKSELRILKDENGRTLRDYRLIVENDELIVENDEGEIFEYRINSREATRIQKAIFSEKQKIIEQSLFGVDINPNSVQITRLRLWIELLKHAWYDENGELVTMPNIDINIKEGNSLVNRYDLHDEIDIPNIKEAIRRYKETVRDYKEGLYASKEEIRRAIDELKGKFRLVLKAEWKETQALKKALEGYVKEFGLDGLDNDLLLKAVVDYNLRPQGQLPGLDDLEDPKVREERKRKALDKLRKIEKKIEEIEKGKIYENAFEWRFEFPEVLDAEGNFVGFDLVIGNPPYFNIDTFGAGSPMLRYLPEHYPHIYMDKSDILFYFIARASELSRSQVAFIVSNAMLFSDKAKKLRNYIVRHHPVRKLINFEKFMVFEEASITSMMLFLQREHTGAAEVCNFKREKYTWSELLPMLEEAQGCFEVTFKEDTPFALADLKTETLLAKIDGQYPKLSEFYVLGKGMETAADKIFTFQEYPTQFPPQFIKKRVTGKNLQKYCICEVDQYILYYEDVDQFEDLPIALQQYLLKNKTTLENRAQIRRSSTAKWWKYTFPIHKELMSRRKLYCSRRAFSNIFALDEREEYLALSNMTVIFETNDKIDIKYVSALLNSKLLTFRYRYLGKQTGNGSFEYFPNGVGKLPIPYISTNEQRPFIEKVDEIIAAKRSGANTMKLEREIDRMVYELYGLSNEEIDAVEKEVTS